MGARLPVHPVAVDPVVCSGCGERIAGTYVQALNRNWHSGHFVCGGCGKPIGEDGFIEAADVAFHPRCHADRFATKCFYCGKPMLGRYVRDEWGIEFCQSHVADSNRCVFCGRLVDGRKIRGCATEAGLRCGVCGGTAVDTHEDAATLYSEVLEWANGRALLIPNVPLELNTRASLMAHAGGPGRHRQLGCTRVSTTTSSKVIVKIDIVCIAILPGLPRILFGAVVAHELGHAWLRANGIDVLSPAEEEGFCEVLAFRWLQEESTPERDYYAKQIASNDDPVYGGGFRLVHAVCVIYGLRGLVDFLWKNKRLPSDA